MNNDLINELRQVYNNIDLLKTVYKEPNETTENIDNLLIEELKIALKPMQTINETKIKIKDNIDELKALFFETPIIDKTYEDKEVNITVHEEILTDKIKETINIVEDITKSPEVLQFKFIGIRDAHPENAKENNFYRNYINKIVYIFDGSNWLELIKDGETTHSGISGGGLGYNDVVNLIKEVGGTSTFNGSASAVSVDNTNFISISGDDVQHVLNSIDYKIATKVLFGEYKTLNMDEEGSIIYVGSESLSGDWYYKKVVTDDFGNITIGYANNYSTSSSYNYSQANINKHDLNYVTIKELGM